VWVVLRDLMGCRGEAGVLSEGHTQRKFLNLSVLVIFFSQADGMLWELCATWLVQCHF